MEEICKKTECSGCGACRDICAHKAIVLYPDSLGALYPVVDEIKCVDCGLCTKICPQINPPLFHTPQKVFAGWSCDENTRRNSASGGIASEIYKYCVRNSIIAYGVEWSSERGCKFVKIADLDDISRVSNSKYVYSDTTDVYISIKNELKNDNVVVFIGLPCQVAGLKKYVGKLESKLYTIDLICHGIAPATYLQQHIAYIEQRKKKKCNVLFFRDPKYGTEKYYFSLRSYIDEKPFYKKRVNEDDLYQLGYHCSLIYRENCYHCHYAKRERVGDLTIGDFNGVGLYGDFPYAKQSVSCVLQNTPKGFELLNKLDKLTLIERNPYEAYDFERQLNHPSIPHYNRQLFIDCYNKTVNFKLSAGFALKKEIRKNRIKSFLKVNQTKDFFRKLIPQGVIISIKRKLKKI